MAKNANLTTWKARLSVGHIPRSPFFRDAAEDETARRQVAAYPPAIKSTRNPEGRPASKTISALA
jgi:hypothetical protein